LAGLAFGDNIVTILSSKRVYLRPRIIEPSLAASVAGRGIGENVLLIQSHADRLKQQNKSALWAL
jgi:hypothetical protein